MKLMVVLIGVNVNLSLSLYWELSTHLQSYFGNLSPKLAENTVQPMFGSSVKKVSAAMVLT